MPSAESHGSWATLGQSYSEGGSLPELRKSIKPLASQFLFVMSRWASAMTSFGGDLAVAILKAARRYCHHSSKETMVATVSRDGGRDVFAAEGSPSIGSNGDSITSCALRDSASLVL